MKERKFQNSVVGETSFSIDVFKLVCRLKMFGLI